MRMPPHGSAVAITVILAAAFVALRGWVLYTRENEIISRFLTHARDGDFANCRAMLAEDPSAVYLLDEQMLQAAADMPLVPEHVSCTDFLLGRRTFRVYVCYANDHSFTVSGDRVTLGGSFWFVRNDPEYFKLVRQVEALGKSNHRRPDDAESEIER